jgi:hypothetical protein
MWRDQTADCFMRLELNQPENRNQLRDVFDRIDGYRAGVDGAQPEAFVDVLARWDRLIDPFDTSRKIDYDSVEATAKTILDWIGTIRSIAASEPRDAAGDITRARVEDGLRDILARLTETAQAQLDAIRHAEPVPVANPVEALVNSVYDTAAPSGPAKAEEEVRKMQAEVAKTEALYEKERSDPDTSDAALRATLDNLKRQRSRLEDARASLTRLKDRQDRAFDRLEATRGDLQALWSDGKDDFSRRIKNAEKAENASNREILRGVRNEVEKLFNLVFGQAIEAWTKQAAATVDIPHGRQFDLDVLSKRAETVRETAAEYFARIDNVFDRAVKDDQGRSRNLKPSVETALSESRADLCMSLRAILISIGSDLNYYHQANLHL